MKFDPTKSGNAYSNAFQLSWSRHTAYFVNYCFYEFTNMMYGLYSRKKSGIVFGLVSNHSILCILSMRGVCFLFPKQAWFDMER